MVILQIVTGFLLSFYIKIETSLVLFSSLTLLKTINNAFLLKSLHSIKSALIMFILYFHIFKSFYYKVWIGNLKTSLSMLSGFIIFFLMMEVCFTGYIIPWGQMSFWGVKVITNVLDLIPVLGIKIIQLILGGTEITNIFIQRILSIHFLSAILLLPLIFLHIWLVHKIKSTNYSIKFKKNSLNFIEFYPISLYKDFFILNIIIIFIFFLSCYNKELLFNFLNNIEITNNSTPNLIVPEWFFLPFYGCLKMMKKKIFGFILVIVFILSILFVVFR